MIGREGRHRQVAGKLKILDLALNVNFAEGVSPCILEEKAGFAREKLNAVLAFCKKFATLILANELCCIGIGFEAKLFGDEAKFDVWLVARES